MTMTTGKAKTELDLDHAGARLVVTRPGDD